METINVLVDQVDGYVCQTRVVGHPDLPRPVLEGLMRWALQKDQGLTSDEALTRVGWEACPDGPVWHTRKEVEDPCWTWDWNCGG